jgi:hypothetical protein
LKLAGSLWQVAQVLPRLPWLIEKTVWPNAAPAQVLVEWHRAQRSPNRPGCAFRSSFAWQEAQAVGVPWWVGPAWHDLQAAAACLPVSLNAVQSWRKWAKLVRAAASPRCSV